MWEMSKFHKRGGVGIDITTSSLRELRTLCVRTRAFGPREGKRLSKIFWGGGN